MKRVCLVSQQLPEQCPVCPHPCRVVVSKEKAKAAHKGRHGRAFRRSLLRIVTGEERAP